MGDIDAKARGNAPAKEIILMTNTKEAEISSKLHDMVPRLYSALMEPHKVPMAHEIIDDLNGLASRTTQTYTTRTMTLQSSFALPGVQLHTDPLQQVLELAKATLTPEKFDAILYNPALQLGRSYYYSQLMQAVFGYHIEFGDQATSEAQRLDVLRKLALSNLIIVNYFNEVLGKDVKNTDNIGLSVFNRFTGVGPNFSWGPKNLNNVTVILGSSYAGGIGQGLTPLPISEDRVGELNKIYLDSAITPAAITHEFFHNMDRYMGLLLSADKSSASSSGELVSLDQFLYSNVENSYTKTTGQYGLEVAANLIPTTSRAALTEQQKDIQEKFADLMMTDAVLMYQGKFGGDYYVHSDNKGEVKFSDSNPSNLKDIRCGIRQYIFEVLTGLPGNLYECT